MAKCPVCGLLTLRGSIAPIAAALADVVTVELEHIGPAVVDALGEFKHLNASVGENELTLHDYIDLGVAEGAKLLVDGRGFTLQGYEKGFYLGGSLFVKR